VQTPDFNQPNTLVASSAAIRTKSLPLLAPIPLVPSRYLQCFRCVGYAAFVFCVTVALWPFVPTYPVLAIVPVVLAIWSWRWLIANRAHRLEQGTLVYSMRGWEFTAPNGQVHSLLLKGEVLIWPALVILPFVDAKTDKPYPLVIAQDSLAPADFARLRTWLRTCLEPKV